MRFQRIGKGKAAAPLGDRVADHGVEVGTGAVGPALRDGVARLALGELLLAGGDIRAGEQSGQRRTLGLSAAFADHAFDGIAGFFQMGLAVGMVIFAAQDRRAQRDDTRTQNPSCYRIAAIVHVNPLLFRNMSLACTRARKQVL